MNAPRSATRSSQLTSHDGGPPRPVVLAASAYGVLGLFAAAVAAYRGASLLRTAPWLPLDEWAQVFTSLAGGAAIALATVRVTPIVVRKSMRVRALHEGLRPSVRGAGNGTLLFMALASGVAEELFFRGALVPWLGALVPSLAFGLLHQVRGPGRWIWVTWAFGMGLVLAALFQATGSLAGCIVAHIAVNAANLRFLRDHDPAPSSRALGGILGPPRAR